MHVTHHRNDLRHRLLFLAGQTGLVALGVFVYFRVRGLTEGSVDAALDHARDVVAFEARLGIDIESSLQSWVAPSESLRTLANWIYIWGHWPVIILTMIWLAWHHRPQFYRLRDAMMVSGAVGMVVFATYPLAPPRLADLGLVDTVTHDSNAYRVLQPPAFTNQYAAMPSLHSGWDLLVGMAIVSAATTLWLRVIGFAMPVLMAFAVVATANHYLVDVIAGVALVLVGHVVALRLERRRVRRREPVAAPAPARPPED
jgi:membrane-associated phospholipid phosphatase